MRYLFAPLCLFCVALSANAIPAPAEKKSAADNLDGEWVCTAVDWGGDVFRGPDLVGKLKFTIAGNKMAMDGPDGKKEAKVTFDFTKRPGWLDFVMESDPKRGGTRPRSLCS
jgi:uncharacterized protein (TIGR03067 family)